MADEARVLELCAPQRQPELCFEFRDALGGQPDVRQAVARILLADARMDVQGEVARLLRRQLYAIFPLDCADTLLGDAVLVGEHRHDVVLQRIGQADAAPAALERHRNVVRHRQQDVSGHVRE